MSSIIKFLSKIFGSANIRALKELQPLVEKINSLEPSIKQCSNDELKAKTAEFKLRIKEKNESCESLLPEAFAVVREAAVRTLGLRPFDVQLMGAIVLNQGKIAEMKTGEGKTLTATLALYLNALSGNGAHLVTVNDYLAQRDADWNRPIYNLLDMSVGVLKNGMSDEERKKQYKCDILYATNNELGFDYLRDNMKFNAADYVQRTLNFAIIDECDSILIDEARTPLIISGGNEESSDLYKVADLAVKNLIATTDYVLDEKIRSIQLTEAGHDKIEQRLKIKNLYAIENINLLHHINQALKANIIFKKDVDYVVRDGEVLIVDEFTGRILAGRRYSDGLHQAIEAKENVEIAEESHTLAAITLQNFFRLYKKLSGMTGTALTEAEELMKIYKLDVISIPTNQPMIRQDKPDFIFLTEAAKFSAIVNDVISRHKNNQPVLIGTIAIEKSEKLSTILQQNGIPHEVLNAKNHAREAEIIKKAGEPGHVTIATNMAGRGTDIKLTAESVAAGGLYVLGTERHESRRIDNQLRGRSGRQGDPGESRFYISLEDDLIRIFSGETMKNTMQRAGMKEDEIIESPTVSKLIEHSQEKVEKHNFESRKYLLEYDDVLNQQRKLIYTIRQNILKDTINIGEIISLFIDNFIIKILKNYFPNDKIETEQIDAFYSEIAHCTKIPKKDLVAQDFYLHQTFIIFKNSLINYLKLKYENIINILKSREISLSFIMQSQQWLVLEILDKAWKQHMVNLDNLKEGINLRGWGQKNPLIEYKRESFILFEDMMYNIYIETLQNIFNISNIENIDSQSIEKKRKKELSELNLISGNQNNQNNNNQAATITNSEKIGRNESCNCGSGKKYKKCCGKIN